MVAEHARSAAFLISDGVTPSNDGRGYVLRRVIRRAIRYGRKLDLEDPFLSEVAAAVIDRMKGQYPDLEERRAFILRVIHLEEERFGQALRTGVPMLEEGLIPFHVGLRDIAGSGPDAIQELANRVGGGVSPSLMQQAVEPLVAALRESGNAEVLTQSSKELLGAEVFALYDTYGLPPELVEEIARENGLEGIDWEGFEREMEAQRERARAAAERFGGDFDAIRAYQDLGVGGTRFLGYEALTAQSVIVGMLIDGKPVERAERGSRLRLC